MLREDIGMRSPRRKRPLRRSVCVRADADLAGLADRATYVGSPEHKDVPSFAGPPRLRGDASCCPRNLAVQQGRLSDWLRTAIRRGAVGAPWEGEFPRYVWYEHENIVFEGRLVNRAQGTYKGYPLLEDEWPNDIEDIYGTA